MYFFCDVLEIVIYSLFDKYDYEKNGKFDKLELNDLLEGDFGLSFE